MGLKNTNQNGLNATKKAIAELEAGLGVKFRTTEQFMDDLRMDLIYGVQIHSPATSSIPISSLKRHKD